MKVRTKDSHRCRAGSGMICVVLGLCVLIHLSCSDSKGGGASAYVTQLEVPDAVFLQDLGLEACHFEVRGLKGHKVTIWIELYKDGQLNEDLCRGAWVSPLADKRVEETFRFSRIHRVGPRKSEAGQVFWQFGFDTTRELRDWMADPLKGSYHIAYAPRAEDVSLVPGQTATVWYLAASDGSYVSCGSAEAVLRNPVAILIKCRMDALGPNEQDSVGSFSGLPKSERREPADHPTTSQ